MAFFDGRSVLITGGTGSFGQGFIRTLLRTQHPTRVAIYSRDELKQQHMRHEFGSDSRVRFFLGDVRDRERLTLAMYGVDSVVHAAALKQVDTAEYNPMEFVRTNILGSENVMMAAIAAGVEKVIALSTDKASSPVNLYGATKLTADKLFVSGNHYSHARGTKFAVVRYGNVLGSRGSVLPLFRHLASRGQPLPITDYRMTRFWITLRQAVQFVVESFEQMDGGEIYVPKTPSMKVTDLAKAVSRDADLTEVGIRPGEKLHEEMISSEDARRTIALPDRFVVAPSLAEWTFREPSGVAVSAEFRYASDTNDSWLSVEDLEDLLDDVEDESAPT